MFPKRPGRGETQDDLLSQQEQFLRQQNKLPKREVKVDNTKEDEEEKNKPKLLDNHDLKISDFQCRIVERDIVSLDYSKVYLNSKEANSVGFPVAPSLSIASNQSRGVSLYAQRYLNKPKTSSTVENARKDEQDLVTGIGLGGQNWKSDIENIKNENKKLISSMNQEEIENMRTDLLKKLNPKTVEFLRSKKFRYRSEVVKEKCEKFKPELMNLEKSSMNVQEDESEKIKEKIAIPIEDVKSKRYPNMDVIENQKLNWLGDIPEKRLKKDPDGSFSARFDFEGNLLDLSDTDKIDVHQGLHHHGEEPERPGYTINELFMYLQSSYPSQKQIGLKVFEKIIGKAYRGYYDACFNQNLIEYLLKDTPLILVVRSCLDESADSVWKSSIATLKAITCNTLYDEIFLDRGYLIFEDFLHYGYQIDLGLKPKLEKEIEFDDEVLDQQYMMYDVIECLLNRTSILQRFAYLINNELFEYDVPFIEEMFDIMIRLARHSKESAEKIIDLTELMDAMFSKILHKNVLLEHLNMVHVKAFKLFRVCITSIQAGSDGNLMVRSLKTLLDRFIESSLIDSLNHCLLLNPEDVSSENGRTMLKVCIESLRLWLKLLSHNTSHLFFVHLIENFDEMFPSFLKILNFCKTLLPTEASSDSSKKSIYNFQFASCVFMLFKMNHEVANASKKYASVYSFDLYDIAMRWFTVLHQDSILPNFDTSLALLVLTEFILKHLTIDTNFVQTTVVNLLKTNQVFVRKLFALCIKNSNTNFLSEEFLGTVRDSSNLPSFGSIYFKGFNSVPLFNHDSVICLLQALFRIVLNVKVSQLTNMNNIDTFDHLMSYIELITRNLKNDLNPNIFDLIEINIVAQASLVVKRALENGLIASDTRISKSVLNFTLCLHVLNHNEIKEEIVNTIILNPCFYSCFTETSDFGPIAQTYRRLCRFDSSYWLFDPLLTQIKNQGNGEEMRETRISLQELVSCLHFIELIFDYFPEYLKKIEINNTLLFEILCSAFLVDDDYFFDEVVQQCMTRFLQKLIQTSSIECSNKDQLPYFGSVVDFYNKFITQFDNCSYGNTTFCNYLLVFFQQKCSPFFRNHLYSEFVHLCKVINLKFSELILPVELLLFPIEVNVETLEIYLKTLLCDMLNPRECPVLYCVLVHHLNHTLFRDNSPLRQSLFTGDNIDKNLQSNFDKLIRSVQMSSNAELRHHLYNYLHFSENSLVGFELKNNV